MCARCVVAKLSINLIFVNTIIYNNILKEFDILKELIKGNFNNTLVI